MLAKKKILGTTLSLLLLSHSLQAQGSAGQAGEFLRWGAGVKALGLGRAFTSVADDASALYWNPAGLSALSRVGGTLMFVHVPLQEGASFNYLAGALPLRLFFVNHQTTSPFLNFVQNLNFGLGFLWHSLGDFEFYNSDASRSNDLSQTSINQTAVYFSFSFPLNPLLRSLSSKNILGPLRGRLEVGLTTKFINQDLFGTTGTAKSFDLGFKYTHHSESFNIGFALRDFNHTKFDFQETVAGDRIPTYGVLGISLLPPIKIMQGLLIAFDYGVVTPGRRGRDLMFGLQYDLSHLDPDLPVTLRIGANSNYENFTIGVKFSPEVLWGNDWLPSGDVAFAKDRSNFNAVGGRYAISMDKNPFTAKYWYLNAMALFPNQRLLAEQVRFQLEKSLGNAENSKNPGRRAYRYEAALRRADLEFLHILNYFHNARYRAFDRTLVRTQFKDLSRQYESRAHRFLIKDHGKNELDVERYLNSFTYYLQSLILAGDLNKAVSVCADSGRTWGKNLNAFKTKTGAINTKQAKTVNYLNAFALFESGFKAEAINLINSELSHTALARYLHANIAFSQGNYPEALHLVEDFDLSQTAFPDHLYLPLTNDGTFGDEILFLRGVCLYKISNPLQPKNYLAEFASIPRFFPDSDLAGFMLNGDAILKNLTDYIEKQDSEKINELVDRMIGAYWKSFSNGTLKQEAYTYNYR